MSCLFLGWLSIAGFGASMVVPLAFGFSTREELRAPVAAFISFLVPLTFVYGLTALIAAIGLWRMSSWGPRAFGAWIMVACVLAIALLVLVRMPLDTPRELVFAFFTIFPVALLGWWRYIRRAYARAGAL